MNFEEVFEHIGHFGLYQFLFMCILGVLQAYFAYQQISMNWLGPSVKHWCRIDGLQDLPHARQKYIGIPQEKSESGSLVYSSCNRFVHNFTQYNQSVLYQWNRTTIQFNETVKCDKGWVYDQTVFLSSVVNKVSLIILHSFSSYKSKCFN